MADFIQTTLKIYFDREKVLRAMDRKVHRALFGVGGYARKTMRSGIRDRKKISQPGEYPSSHTKRLKAAIMFDVNDSTKSVIIGPEYRGRRYSGRTVPNIINEGGTVTGIRRRPSHYRPRPFVALTRPKAVEILRKNMGELPLK